MAFWNRSSTTNTIHAVRSDRSDATRRARRLVQSWANSTNAKANKGATNILEIRVGRAIRSALKRGREGDVLNDKTATRNDRSDAARRARRLIKSTTDIPTSKAAMSDLETRVARAIRSALKRGRAY